MAYRFSSVIEGSQGRALETKTEVRLWRNTVHWIAQFAFLYNSEPSAQG